MEQRTQRSNEQGQTVTIDRGDLAWLLSCAIDHADHPQYKRPYAALQEAIGEVPPSASTEPVIDRGGVRVYATDAGRYVAADKGGWVEGTFGTPEEAWAAGAPGE